MNLAHWYRKGSPGVGEATVEEVTAIARDGSKTWGNQQNPGYRSEQNISIKDMWQREEIDRFTKISLGLELDEEKEYRIWLEGEDTGDPDEASTPDVIRNVYDKDGQFVHCVVTF